MPPAKRKLPPTPKPEKVINTGSTICYCSKCSNKGVETKEFIYKCLKGVNAPYGNHSIVKCIYYNIP